jgi:hypothetical protein
LNQNISKQIIKTKGAIKALNHIVILNEKEELQLQNKRSRLTTLSETNEAEKGEVQPQKKRGKTKKLKNKN